MRNRDDACAAHQSDRGLDADETGQGCGGGDRSVGLGAHGDGGKTGRNGSSGTRAGAAGVAVQCVGVAREPAARTPAAGAAGGADVGPLRQIGLAQNDGACCAQPGDKKGVFGWLDADQGQRTSRCLHSVCGGNVVLQKNRDAVQRSARSLGLAFLVEDFGYLQCVGVEFDDGVDLRPGFVNARNPVEVGLDELHCADLAGRHGGLQFGHGLLGGVESGQCCCHSGSFGECAQACECADLNQTASLHSEVQDLLG